MKNNIGKLKDCYGCGVCTAVCPVKIINLKENAGGFYSPQISNEEKCINCELCLKVCAFNHKELSLQNAIPKSHAGYSKNDIIRQRCSSGGVGFEIARFLIEKGYKACGVRYDISNERAEHFIASSVEEYTPSIGSKYIQSFSQTAFSEISRKEKYFVSGTPCQIDSFRRYIRHLKIEDNFILLDFFCHGVPSMLLWRDYLHNVEKEIGKAGFVSWRNKTNGWHDSWNMNVDPVESNDIDWHNSYNINILEKKHFYQSRWKGGDLFYKFFLSNYCLNKCCYKSCKYKCFLSSADIRIGDLWGKTFKDENLGTNAVIVFTENGAKILEQLKQCNLSPIATNTCVEGQMKKCPSLPLIYRHLLKALGKDEPLQKTFNHIVKPYRLLTIPKRIMNLISYKLGIKLISH